MIGLQDIADVYLGGKQILKIPPWADSLISQEKRILPYSLYLVSIILLSLLFFPLLSFSVPCGLFSLCFALA